MINASCGCGGTPGMAEVTASGQLNPPLPGLKKDDLAGATPHIMLRLKSVDGVNEHYSSSPGDITVDDDLKWAVPSIPDITHNASYILETEAVWLVEIRVKEQRIVACPNCDGPAAAPPTHSTQKRAPNARRAPKGTK